jgi:hypothetical protein
MSAGWSWAFDTPFTWFKQNASKLGGIRQNMAVSWPARINITAGRTGSVHTQPMVGLPGARRRVVSWRIAADSGTPAGQSPSACLPINACLSGR